VVRPALNGFSLPKAQQVTLIHVHWYNPPIKKKRRETIYAFIDSQNLNLGTKKDIYHGRKRIHKGWELDFKKFRIYLKNKFRVSKTFLFIGYVKKYQKLYKQLEGQGYDLVFKPTVKDGRGSFKGNVDAELVLYAARIQFKKYDKAVIVSGDDDCYCLHKELERESKLLKIVIPNSKSESSLLKKFQKYKVFIQREREKLEK